MKILEPSKLKVAWLISVAVMLLAAVPAGTIHSAKNIGAGNGAELATYTVEKRKPLITLVQ